ncbi:hypothetical protein JCM10450v2_005567 [Rhodotorula kratochvilovae]
MPPERSASSFAEAQALGLPLSSHGARHPPSIARGLACQACRRRKLKCDGVKPLCGACKKSAAVHGDDTSSLSCQWDDPNAPKKKRASPGSKVAALEAEISELKAQLAQTRLQSPPAPEAPVASTSFAAIPPPSVETGFEQSLDMSGAPSFAAPVLDLNFSSADPTLFPPPPSASFSASTPYFPMPVAADSPRFVGLSPPAASNLAWCPPTTQQMPGLSPPGTHSSSTDTSPPFTPPSDPLFELFYPGWPRDLPPPGLTHRLLDVYFARPHICAGMINAVRFRAAMLLPPTSNGFPHPALIHILCAIACMMISDDFFTGEERYWKGFERPTEYHAARCKAALEVNLGQGPLFQVAQVFSLLCYWSYCNARWVELWLYCGQATRVSTPLGLNHLRAASDSPTDLPAHFKGHLMPPTNDDEQLAEQSLTFFMAFMADRYASASTGWACSIDDVDVTTVIPTEGVPYPRGEAIGTSPNSLHSAAFFVAHPPHLCGPLQLFIKAVVLLGKIVQFQQRAPHANKTMGGGLALNDNISDVRQTDAFKRLDGTVEAFIASIPREYQFQHRAPGSGNGDVLTENRLCLVHGMSHVSRILLHEPYVATLEEDEPSMVKCAASANEILQSIFLILGTSYEIALFAPYINFVWAVAGRTFIRMMAIKQVKGLTYGVEELKSNVSTIMVVLKAHRTPLGDNTHLQLSSLLAEPLRCLPRAFLPLANISPLPAHVPNHMTECGVTLAMGPSLRPYPTSGVEDREREEDDDQLLRGMNAGQAPPGMPVMHGMAARFDAAGTFVETTAAAGDEAKPPVEVVGDWYARQGLAGLEQLLQMQP